MSDNEKPKSAKKEDMKSFSLVVIDVDDTLIPTTIRKKLKSDFDIDVFEYLSKKSLKRLQMTVIKGIDDVVKSLKKANDIHHGIRVALVSNAGNLWLKYVLGGDDDDSKFTILSKYLNKNNIPIISAASDCSLYLKSKFGDDPKNLELYVESLQHYSDNKWLWKYTTVSLLISSMQKELHCLCTQIISFGDGMDEKVAMQKLSRNLGRDCIHFEFIKFPTVYQLRKQWQFVANNFSNLCRKVNKSKQINGKSCFLYQFDDVFSNDNNQHFTGETEQMPSVALYFKYWLESLNDLHEETEIFTKYKEGMMNAMLSKIHVGLFQPENKECVSYKCFKKIVLGAVCCHEEFDNALRVYISSFNQ